MPNLTYYVAQDKVRDIIYKIDEIILGKYDINAKEKLFGQGMLSTECKVVLLAYKSSNDTRKIYFRLDGFKTISLDFIAEFSNTAYSLNVNFEYLPNFGGNTYIIYGTIDNIGLEFYSVDELIGVAQQLGLKALKTNNTLVIPINNLNLKQGSLYIEVHKNLAEVYVYLGIARNGAHIAYFIYETEYINSDWHNGRRTFVFSKEIMDTIENKIEKTFKETIEKQKILKIFDIFPSSYCIACTTYTEYKVDINKIKNWKIKNSLLGNYDKAIWDAIDTNEIFDEYKEIDVKDLKVGCLVQTGPASLGNEEECVGTGIYLGKLSDKSYGLLKFNGLHIDITKYYGDSKLTEEHIFKLLSNNNLIVRGLLGYLDIVSEEDIKHLHRFINYNLLNNIVIPKNKVKKLIELYKNR